jgi:hypothetical protein
MIRHSDWIGTDCLAAIDFWTASLWRSVDQCKSAPGVRIPTQRVRVADACARAVRGAIRVLLRGSPARVEIDRRLKLIGMQGFWNSIRVSMDRVGRYESRMRRDVE